MSEHLRLLRGGKPRTDAGPGRIPVAEPPMPQHLCTLGRREWRRVVPLLLELGLLTKLDAAALALYCAAWGQLQAAEQALQAEMRRLADAGEDPAKALIETSARSGLSRASALQRLVASSRAEADRYLAALGLTPAARLRMSVGSGTAQVPRTATSRFFKDDPDQPGFADL